MAYEGEVLDACGLFKMDFSTVGVVAVSGSGPNLCGHLILHTPANDGIYFHVAGSVHGYPRYMSEGGYARYMQENGKSEYLRRYMELPNPDGAFEYVEQTLSAAWAWGVLPHNCVTFCEGVIAAGGGEWSSYSNCPVVAVDVPQYMVSRFLANLQADILSLYGVPY